MSQEDAVMATSTDGLKRALDKLLEVKSSSDERIEPPSLEIVGLWSPLLLRPAIGNGSCLVWLPRNICLPTTV